MPSRPRFTVSEFHYGVVFLDGAALVTPDALLAELRFKLGLPRELTWDGLQDALTLLGDPRRNRCAHWEPRPGKHCVLQIAGLDSASADRETLFRLLQLVVHANDAIARQPDGGRIWLEPAIQSPG
jgi:hypothetical protein